MRPAATRCGVRDTLGKNEIQAEFDLRIYQPTAVPPSPPASAPPARFDALARLLHKVQPGDSEAEPTIAHAYDTSSLPVQVTVSYRTSAATPRRVERQFIDGSGRLLERRPRRTRWARSSNRCNVYGPRGVLARMYLPRRPAGPVVRRARPQRRPHDDRAYDALGGASAHSPPRRRRGQADQDLPGVVEQADEEDNRDDAAGQHAGTVTRRFRSMPPGGLPAPRSGWARRCSPRPIPTTSRAGLTEHADASGAQDAVHL